MAVIPNTTSNVQAAITSATNNAANAAKSATDSNTLAGNFQTFLTLLTTQLKNQNPLDPLDTNQFTQQLVQFAQVEQQIKQNSQLETLIAINKAAETTTALAYVGTTVAIDGKTAALKNQQATWTFNVPKPVSTTVTIKNATGQTVYNGNFSMNAGQSTFEWDGRDANGVQWPDGNYTISVTAKDANGQTVEIPSEIQGVVDSVDVTKTPPELSVGGQTFTLDKIKRVVRPA
ncbi:MAG TPA: flagellar hook capping FlgD N-terminal domain-containing protein [Xanthobacteraceae bacterium]|nr:flagellar hook capping FlgD N-terminal domain-containing protein [Xanthobacteraceae bacterium]